MAIFFCAIPVGSALGYVVGGLMDVHFGWRVAFFVAGIPGLALAALCLLDARSRRAAARIGAKPAQDAEAPTEPAPPLGNIGADTSRTTGAPEQRPTVHGTGLRRLHLRHGRARLLDARLSRARARHAPWQATISFGYIVVITGFVGTFVGGWLGDYCAKYSKRAYLVVSAAATVIAAPFRVVRADHRLGRRRISSAW
jgi:MFS family permease